ncbi:hypothetical protein IV498_09520 [Paenarthrobacter sp. Z7-10]|uniref:HGxxPAAW family protein n=1 Tax=Paenarthrobacter sp. Z7-10 TaxID=2787635 RepID=UPI0022A93F4B|nr:HGxxPAAW family protein [Paenarthrobacter sp. Z7-10]MCZ2403415.1 hypothetical protein [Paenarthrobacter sp. Z7-10]
MSNKPATRSQPIGTTEDAAHPGELGHGNSPAAWTCVAIMLVGSLISCIAFAFGPSATIPFILGLVIMVIGLGVGWAMRRAGYGVGGDKLKNDGH